MTGLFIHVGLIVMDIFVKKIQNLFLVSDGFILVFMWLNKNNESFCA